MSDLSEFDLQLYKKIVGIVESGNESQDAGAYESALEKYGASWDMLPEPKEKWDLAHWIAKCFSEAYLEQEDYNSAKMWALRAVETKPPRETSSFIVLGASYLGLGEEGCAIEFFNKAFERGEARAFQGFDKKYIDFFAAYKKRK